MDGWIADVDCPHTVSVMVFWELTINAIEPALIDERVSGVPFHDLVVREVCERAALTDTAFLRSDDLPADAALGYLFAEGNRTNVLHLPVRSGQG